MPVGVWIGLGAFAYAATWFPISHWEGTLLSSQMLQKYPGETKVIPAIADFFIWADLLLLPIILGWMAQVGYEKWTKEEIAAAAMIGVVATFLFHEYMILPGQYPATLGWKGGHHIVGYLHMPFMAAALAIILLHFVRLDGWTPHLRGVDPTTALRLGLLLLLQITLDLHVPMKFIQARCHFIWYPAILVEDPKQVPMLLSGYAAVAILTALTGGAFSGLTVSVAALVWGAAILLGP